MSAQQANVRFIKHGHFVELATFDHNQIEIVRELEKRAKIGHLGKHGLQIWLKSTRLADTQSLIDLITIKNPIIRFDRVICRTNCLYFDHNLYEYSI